MFRPLALCIGLRYTRAKRKQHFISFIALVSMLGIALGVTVLLTVLSIMNGFDEQIEARVFEMVPQVMVVNPKGISGWQALSHRLSQYPEVQAKAPFVSGYGMLSYSGQGLALGIMGIDPKQQDSVMPLSSNLIAGSLSKLKPGSFGMVLGEAFSQRLGLSVGDKAVLYLPEAQLSFMGAEPRLKTFTVMAVFKAGSGFGFDAQLGFIHLSDAQAMYRMDPTSITGIRLKLNNVFQAPALKARLVQDLNQQQHQQEYEISDWTDQFGSLFKALKMEKNMMFFVLALIIAVAAFNLVASLVMLVHEKQADIAILRTFGLLPSAVMAIFMVQGMVIGFLGTVMGVIGGSLLSVHAAAVLEWIQRVFQVEIFIKGTYFTDLLPSKLLISDIALVSGTALVLSFLATLYPGFQASRIQPAEALRYE